MNTNYHRRYTTEQLSSLFDILCIFVIVEHENGTRKNIPETSLPQNSFIYVIIAAGKCYRHSRLSS